VWGDTTTKSGPGSNLKNTHNLIEELQKIIKNYNIKKILDIPCGDFFWFKQINVHGIDYKGGDIVKSLIKNNQKKYGCKNINFFSIDIRKDKLPEADLLICRDLFIHLSNKDILETIKNIRNSSINYVLLTTYKKITENTDIPTGKFRPINLFLPPFNFDIPILEFLDTSQNSAEDIMGKSICLWRNK
jgi:hypothetical protein